AVPDLAVAPGARGARGERARDLDADGLVGARRATDRAAGGHAARAPARGAQEPAVPGGAWRAGGGGGCGAARRVLAPERRPGRRVAPADAPGDLGAADQLPPAAHCDPVGVCRAPGAAVRGVELRATR